MSVVVIQRLRVSRVAHRFADGPAANNNEQVRDGMATSRSWQRAHCVVCKTFRSSSQKYLAIARRQYELADRATAGSYLRSTKHQPSKEHTNNLKTLANFVWYGMCVYGHQPNSVQLLPPRGSRTARNGRATFRSQTIHMCYLKTGPIPKTTRDNIS
jgi:hypothetical protein